MQPLHDSLAPISAGGGCDDAYGQGAMAAELGLGLGARVDAAMAREEYELSGQEGLDELLAALGGGSEVVCLTDIRSQAVICKVVLCSIARRAVMAAVAAIW